MIGSTRNRKLWLGLAALALVGLACTCSLGDRLGGGGSADVGDYVWLDMNRNGIQDTDERGLPGVHVRLLDEDGQTVQDTVTDEDGLYLFTDVADGQYVIEFSPLPDYSFTLLDAGLDDGVDSDARQTDGRTEPFDVAGSDDSRDAGLIPREEPTPTAPAATATTAPTPTEEAVEEPVIEVTFEHTMPGSYSEIIVRATNLAEGQTVAGQVTTANMSAIDGDGSFVLTGGADGTAEARITIYQFADYLVVIPELGVTETVTVN